MAHIVGEGLAPPVTYPVYATETRSKSTFIVGRGLAPAETSVKMPPKREADPFLRRVRRLPTYRNLSGICHPNAKQIPTSVGMVNDHPQNAGRFNIRKHEIGNKSFCHADEQCSSLRKCFVSSTNAVRHQTPCRGSTKALPYKSAETFIECHPNA